MEHEIAVILDDGDGVITIDANRLVSLTSLWKAAGSNMNKRPTHFVRSNSAIEFVVSLAESLGVDVGDVIVAKQGSPSNGAGTWSHWQVALFYAKWLSPEFHRVVNEAFVRWSQEERNPQLKMDHAKAAASLAKAERSHVVLSVTADQSVSQPRVPTAIARACAATVNKVGAARRRRTRLSPRSVRHVDVISVPLDVERAASVLASHFIGDAMDRLIGCLQGQRGEGGARKRPMPSGRE